MDSDGESDKKMDTPVICAMKGLPCTGKSYWVREIGRLTGCPVLSQDDMRSSLSHFHLSSNSDPTPENDRLDEACFQALIRAASTLLNARQGVVIDSPLSKRASLDYLIRLKSAYYTIGARLVVVECRPKNQNRWSSWLEQRVYGNDITEKYPYKKLTWDDVDNVLEHDSSSDYKVDDASLILLDTAETIDKFQVVGAIQDFINTNDILVGRLPEWMPSPTYLVGTRTEMPREDAAADLLVEEEVSIYSRYHAFEFAYYNWRSELKDGEVAKCAKCLEPITGKIYNCNQFKVLLHKSCAELPKDVVIYPRHQPPFPIHSNEEGSFEYSFPEVERCQRCAEKDEQLFQQCDSCLFSSHLKSNMLPTVFHHECHEHALFLRINPVSKERAVLFNTFVCEACGDAGENIWYFCDDCNFRCHVKCAFSPVTVKNVRHRHVLTRRQPPRHDLCNACETVRDPRHWVYYCEDCDFACHLNCVTLSG